MEQPFLYHYPLSFESQIARLALAEKEVKWQGRHVDIGPSHKNYSNWYMNISLNGEVPVLVHDGENIRGGIAIAKYVNRHFAGTELMPRNPHYEAVCESWIREVENFPVQAFSYAVAPGLAGMIARNSFRRSLPALKKYRRKARRAGQKDLVELYDQLLDKLGNWRRVIADRKRVAEQRTKSLALLDKIEQQLAERPWIAESYSLADVVWAAFLARLELLGFSKEWKRGKRPHLGRYYKELRKRSAFRKAGVYRRIPVIKVLPSLIKGYGPIVLVFTVLLVALMVWSR